MPTGLEAAGSALPPSVVRNIADKLYDKRKLAALEIEQLVKREAAAGHTERIMELASALGTYALSSQSNARKGGLLGLAATAVGLAAAPGPPEMPGVLHKLVPPILNSFTDKDSRVRYYAAEALYNVAKSLRGQFMEVFTDCFEALFKICSDPDPSVQSAATFLDRLIKDIVAESHSFDLEGFLPLLQEYLTVGDPYKRQFLLSWLGLLDSLPDISLVHYLPRLLPGLLGLLSDSNPEIRQGATKLLQEFLLEVHTSPPGAADLPALAAILAAQLLPTPPSAPTDVATQLTALRWLHELIELGGDALAPSYADLLRAVLPCLSDGSTELCQAARQVNESLLQRCSGRVGDPAGGEQHAQHTQQQKESGLVDPPSLLAAVRDRLEGEQGEVAKLEALRWVHALMAGGSREALMRDDAMLGALGEALSSHSDRVVLESLGVLASIAEDPPHFLPVMRRLLGCFRGAAGAKLLQRRGALIVQFMCKRLGGQQVYRAVAGLAGEGGESDLPFAAAMVQAFNVILLTSPELGEMRQLISRAGWDPEGADLLSDLFASWACSCGAALALCLLGQMYGLACELVEVLGHEPLCCSVDVLVQVSQLAQLLEAPSLSGLRLQLLHPGRHPLLMRALYGVLMLLPQSGEAFRTLHTRLQCAPTLALLAWEQQQEEDEGPAPGGSPEPAGAAAGQSPQQAKRRSGWWAGRKGAGGGGGQKKPPQPMAAHQHQQQHLRGGSGGGEGGGGVDEEGLLQLFMQRQDQLHRGSPGSGG